MTDVDIDPGLDGYIRYANHLRDAVLAGEHPLTVRFEFERDLSPGDRVALVDEDGRQFGTATVATVGEMTAIQFVKQDFDDYRSFGGLSEFAAHLRRYYPDAEFYPGSRVHTIRLEDVKPAKCVPDGGQVDGGERVIAAVDDHLEELDGSTSIEVECGSSAAGFDFCDYVAEIELEAPARIEDDSLVLPGFEWSCPDCDQAWEFRIDGVGVSRLV